jgi:NAD(P)-dependent dehydrogenase (short-subunit alcohol dehydrogenase family)
LEELTERQIRTQVETNLMGVLLVSRAVIPYMRRQRSGAIINLSSIAGRIGFPFYSLYTATKFAVEGFSESLAYELLPLGIRVKVIEPGPIDTDFFRRSAVYADVGKTSVYKGHQEAAFKRMQGGNRTFISQPQEIASLIYRVSEDRSSRLRYPAGRIAPVMLLVSRFLPDRLLFHMIRMLTKRKE